MSTANTFGALRIFHHSNFFLLSHETAENRRQREQLIIQRRGTNSYRGRTGDTQNNCKALSIFNLRLFFFVFHKIKNFPKTELKRPPRVRWKVIKAEGENLWNSGARNRVLPFQPQQMKLRDRLKANSIIFLRFSLCVLCSSAQCYWLYVEI